MKLNVFRDRLNCYNRMKYIDKSIKNEPEILKEYRNTTDNATYSGFVDTNHALKKVLLWEQGEICAYCMQRISLKQSRSLNKPRIEVEHILPQKKYPSKDLDFKNMVGVCNGNFGGNEHCDKSKKNIELSSLIPTDHGCESLITFSISGEILSVSNNKFVEKDVNEILNLNNQQLVDLRKSAADLAINLLKKTHPIQDWNVRHFEKLIEVYTNKNKKGQYKEFCNYVIWYLEKLKNSSKYQSR